MKRIIVFFVSLCIAEISCVKGQDNTTTRAGVFDAGYVKATTIHYSSNDIGICQYGYPSDTLKKITEKKLPKELREYLKTMKFIMGGECGIRRNKNTVPTENDTTLLFFNHAERISTPSFLMSETEVTNKEYREFVYWVRDSVAHAFLANKDPKYYLNQSTKQLNMELPINWGDSILYDRLYQKEPPRFYKRREIDTRLLNYAYTDNTGKRITLNVYPDTLQWVNEYIYSFNEPMTQMYFWHPAYNNYPVVGVSWEQATAYCYWKSMQLNKLLKKYKINFSAINGFRLPENVEWEYAATGKKDERLEEGDYSWDDEGLMDHAGKYYANLGMINDKNNVVVKSFYDDDAFHTIVVRHYKANVNGLYDMGGNAAEWVEDAPPAISLRNYFTCVGATGVLLERENSGNVFRTHKDSSTSISSVVDTLLPKANYEITDKDDVHSLLKRIVEIQNLIPDHFTIDTTNDYGRKRIINDVDNLLHDWKIMQHQKASRIVKGGSWADPPIYLHVGMNGIYQQDKSSCRIGFRVAMSVSKEMLPYFYRNKFQKIHEKKRSEILKKSRVKHH